MKVAKARYVGRKGEHSVRTPSGDRVRFPRRDRERSWVDIEDVEVARDLEERRNYEVDWHARGRLLAAGKDVLELGYQKKRSLASDVDLSFDGQPDEDELDDELEAYIEAMEETR